MCTLGARLCILLLKLGFETVASDLDSARDAYSKGIEALDRGDFREAKTRFLAALEAGQRGGMTDPDLTRIRVSLGITQRGLLEWSAAADLLSEAVRHLEQEPETNPALLATAMNALGVVRVDQGRFADAERLLRRAAELFRKTAGPLDPRTLSALAQLGDALFAQDRVAEAERALVEATDGLRNTGDRTALLGNALAGLGRVRLSQGRFREAQSLLSESTDINLKFAGESGAAADSMLTLAIAFRVDRQSERALPLLRRAEKIYSASGDIRVTSVWMVLGGIELDEGKTALAERHSRQAVEWREQAGGRDDVSAAMARVGLARTLGRQRELAEARAEIDRALETERKSFGPTHHEIAEAYLVSAEIAELAKEYAAADRHYREAIELYTSAFSADHPYVTEARREYASFLKHKKK